MSIGAGNRIAPRPAVIIMGEAGGIGAPRRPNWQVRLDIELKVTKLSQRDGKTFAVIQGKMKTNVREIGTIVVPPFEIEIPKYVSLFPGQDVGVIANLKFVQKKAGKLRLGYDVGVDLLKADSTDILIGHYLFQSASIYSALLR